MSSAKQSQKPQGRVLVADDEQAITAGLSAILSDEGYEVEIAHDGQKALDLLTNGTYGVVLADLKMPKVDGIALLKAMREREIPTEFIMITGQGTTETALQAMREGAADYIEKPLNAERLAKLKAQVPKLLEQFAVHQKNQELSARLEGLTHFGELTGQSEEMREVYRIIDAVAPSTASVLILGESGTGKELVAKALHQKSERSKGPFFALNCAALPKEILENELFGHEKGAFTGSTNEKPGAFEMSSGGTIFLDEVAEMSPDIQVKLLRALESRMVRRLGGKKEIPVDIRVVAATNKDVEKAKQEGQFREDLYYRLAVVELPLPPLRERAGDLQLLAEEFLERFAQQNGKKVTGFDDDAMKWVLSYHWPGNVRELKNAVERAVIMSRGGPITAADLMPLHRRNSGEAPASVVLPAGASLAEGRKQQMLTAFAAAGGDLTRAARTLGISSDELRSEILRLLGAGGTRGTDRTEPVPGGDLPTARTEAPAAAGAGTAPRGGGKAAPASSAAKKKK